MNIFTQYSANWSLFRRKFGEKCEFMSENYFIIFVSFWPINFSSLHQNNPIKQ